MLKLYLVLLLATAGLASEPKWPTSICTTLKATLKESSTGYLPESAENHPDTKNIQNALNKCGSGKALKLVKGGGNAFLSGPLTIPSGVTLWIDSGVTLFASRNPRDYDKTSNACGVLGKGSTGCKALITVSNTKNSGIVGQGIIDGRGGQKMIGNSETWWELALKAKNSDKDQRCPRLIVVENSHDFTLYKITLHNSPNFHVVTHNVEGLTVWGVVVETPSKAYASSTHARNTDAFDPNGSNIHFNNVYISTGDDNIAIKGGASQVKNVLIENCHFYKGHGMSIGSETTDGVQNVTVKNLSIDGADNGIRIKSDASNGGPVSNIHYENVCMRNVGVPLTFDSFYTNKKGSHIPNFQDIHLSNVRVLSSTNKNAIFRGYDKNHPVKVSLTNFVSDVTISKIEASNAEITLQGCSNLQVSSSSGNNVKVSNKGGKSSPIDCSKMFPSFPH